MHILFILSIEKGDQELLFDSLLEKIKAGPFSMFSFKIGSG